HQALEAKENVNVQNESQTLASITYQNYFRLYPKLAGMTGTALTEAQEFDEIYKLRCVEVPTNLPVRRVDYNDEIYLTEEEKYEAIVKLVKECHAKQQPVLIGTVSIEKSEKLNKFLISEGIHAQVLNAKYHESEAYIIAQAGVPGAITIATNMAGRGTDIQLGGNLEMRVQQETKGIDDPELLKKKIDEIKVDIKKKKEIALQAGGLYVIGTERHESRRIDNQLRGRTGRQGDPGASKFFLSMEDDLMRIFGGEKMKAMLSRLGLKRGEAIVHPWVSRALEKAQMKVEAHNFTIRKNLLKYDDVMNEQRKIVYSQRHEVMALDEIHKYINDIRLDVIEDIVDKAIPEKSIIDDWNFNGLDMDCFEKLGVKIDFKRYMEDHPQATPQDIFNLVKEGSDARMAFQENRYSSDFMRYVEKAIFLQTLDQVWKEHLLSLDFLKQGIGLRAYGQKDPLNEYKREAFITFEENMLRIKYKTVQLLARTDFSQEGIAQFTDEDDDSEISENRPAEQLREVPAGVDLSIGRNDPCPCGSGLKYKYCHGKLK
ncbi:MAG: SEC-C domain-containing protein, partial [Alphaproteobacteria bacterium]|nr:SEC-C domain-containing protein [Alphaproteobacteria bacterium]